MKVCFGLLLYVLNLSVLLGACSPLTESGSSTELRQLSTATSTTESAGIQTYRNDDYRFSLTYPLDWIRAEESYQSVVLVSQDAASWQPETPVELPQSPGVRVEAGEYIRERAGASSFPTTINANRLHAWLAEMASRGEVEHLTERVIDGQLAYELTSVGESGCLRIVYWRPNSINDLVKLSTGCESQYLDGFDAIVTSLKQTD